MLLAELTKHPGPPVITPLLRLVTGIHLLRSRVLPENSSSNVHVHVPPPVLAMGLPHGPAGPCGFPCALTIPDVMTAAQIAKAMNARDRARCIEDFLLPDEDKQRQRKTSRTSPRPEMSA